MFVALMFRFGIMKKLSFDFFAMIAIPALSTSIEVNAFDISMSFESL
jgi:hypothetical protein